MENLKERLKNRLIKEWQYIKNIKRLGLENIRFMEKTEKENQRLAYYLLEQLENDSMRMRQELQEEKEKFLVILRVDGCSQEELEDSIQSVFSQIYTSYELVVIGCGAVYETVLKKYKKKSNISFRECKENMCQTVINDVVREHRTKIKYVFLLKGEARLHPYALGYILLYKKVRRFKEGVIYLDELLVSKNDKIKETFFKPDFGIDTIRGQNYIGNTLCISIDIWEKLRGLDEQFKDGYLYDFILRMSEKDESGKRIYHIPQPLVKHQRKVNKYTEDGKNVLNSHLKRMHLGGTVEEYFSKGGEACYKIDYALVEKPLVSIMIPNKDHVDILRQCVESILKKTTYSNYEILILENNSTDKNTFAYYEELKKEPKIHVIVCKARWNYSYINNYGARYCKGKYLILLNNDTQVITEDWIEQMLMYAQRSNIGAVGGKLFYPDDTIQHAGVIVGIRCVAGHAFRGWEGNTDGYMNRLITVQNLSAVTAACMMIPKAVFEEISGLDVAYQVAFNDVDLCMRLQKAGYQIVYNPFVKLYHYESKSRGYDEQSSKKLKRFNRESMRFQRQWCKELAKGDPHYNRNLSIWNDDFIPIKTYTNAD